MQREIKFRYIVQDGDTIKKLFVSIEETEKGFGISPDKKVIARSQFTGMKGDGQDEIYEDDICRWNTARNGSTIGTIVYEQQACAFWFKWFDGAAHRYKELRVNFSDGELWLNDNIEVLGNIHENSELLTVGGKEKFLNNHEYVKRSTKPRILPNCCYRQAAQVGQSK